MGEIAGATGIGRATLYTYFAAGDAGERHGTELAALVHRGEHVGRARRQLSDLLRDLIVEAAEAGTLRTDVEPDELASYCLHALGAAAGLASTAAVRRLVDVTLTGLRGDT